MHSGMKGYVHLYTGNGKGKTTAALGLALRSAGAGKTVYIAQFVKGMHYSELEALRLLPSVNLKQYGRDCFIVRDPAPEDRMAARKGFEEAAAIVRLNLADVVILDEISIALHYRLLETEEVVSLIREKPESMEMVLTGRYAPPALYEMADLITEMKEIKHYFNRGVEARKGIEY